MTSTIKLGLVGLGLVGAGIGAFFVNRGMDEGGSPVAKNTESTATDPGAEGRTGTDAATGGRPTDSSTGSEPAPRVTLEPMTEPNSERVASPPALGLRDGNEDAERTWRPRPLETLSPGIADSTPPAIHDDPTVTRDDRNVIPPPAGRTDTSTGTTDRDLHGNPTVTYTPPEPAGEAMGERTPPAPPRSDRVALEPTTRPGTATLPPAARPITPTVAEATAPKPTIHVVASGDTFSGLAMKYLGHAKHANLIAKANPKVSPRRMYVGTKLNIPAAPMDKTEAAVAGSGASRSTVPVVTAPPVDPSRAYTIKAGDSWNGLGKKFLGDSKAWTIVYELNRERFPRDSRTLKPGMVIEIPQKPAAAAPAAKKPAV